MYQWQETIQPTYPTTSRPESKLKCPHTHTLDSPLIVVKLLLHKEEISFQLIPLKKDVTHLLLGEAWLIRILLVSRRLFARLICRLTCTGLKVEETVSGFIKPQNSVWGTHCEEKNVNHSRLNSPFTYKFKHRLSPVYSSDVDTQKWETLFLNC